MYRCLDRLDMTGKALARHDIILKKIGVSQIY